jgi:hypothetical protein
VDPGRLAEAEFPVICPQCAYLLRGLPDGSCPECGRPFERGRLLVQQYVHEFGSRAWARSVSGRIAAACRGTMAVCVLLTCLTAVGSLALHLRASRLAPAGWLGNLVWVRAIFYSYCVFVSLAGLAATAWLALWIRHMVRFRKKRFAVIDALEASADDSNVCS